MSARHPRTALAWLIAPVMLALSIVPSVTGATTPAAAATPAPGHLSLTVRDITTLGDPTPTQLKTFKWMVSAERTGGAYGYSSGNPVPAGERAAGRAYDATGLWNDATTNCLPATAPADVNGDPTGSSDPNFADSCLWPSTRYTPGAVPVVAVGTEADLAGGASGGQINDLVLEPGRYLVSVTADGYKIDGAHVSVDGDASVTVDMHPTPVPLGAIRAHVFKDTRPVDGTYEAGVEDNLVGFTAHLNDPMGEVTTDWFGNPLCTEYHHVTAAEAGTGAAYDGQKVGGVAFDTDGKPVIAQRQHCLSDANGDVYIPNLGPDRYTLSVVPPTGEQWFQTTTLEGNHDWDMWMAEGDTGYDNEMTIGGELVPPVNMGYVPSTVTPTTTRQKLAGTATVTGIARQVYSYIGGKGGVVAGETGVPSGKFGPILPDAIVALSDLQDNDEARYVGTVDPATGAYTIPNVPEGAYQLTVWDLAQDMILQSFNVEVKPADTTVDVGTTGIVGWWTEITGTVFVDTNGNGKRDVDPATGKLEVGVPKFALAYKERDNSLMDAGINGTSTDEAGDYKFTEAYPISNWMVLEAFNTRFKTTGVTIQAENEPAAHTYLGGGVDLSVLPVIGLTGRVDWGVQPYSGGENGGIVGTVTYDTTRNELDAADAVTEPYQPGIPGLTMHLHKPIYCDHTLLPADPDYVAAPDYAPRATCADDDNWRYPADVTAANGTRAADYAGLPHAENGAAVLLSTSADGTPLELNSYVTETYHQPRGCTARDNTGAPLTDQNALSVFGESDPHLCVAAPMAGWMAKPADYDTNPDGTPALDANGNYTNFGQTVNGNYGFVDSTVDLNELDPATGDPNPNYLKPLPDGQTQTLPNEDYVVSVDIPKTANGKDMYEVTQEEDVNVFDGDSRLPQENFDQAAPGSQPTGGPAAGDPGQGGPISQQPGIVSGCVGALHTVTVKDQAFLDAGGSPFEGQDKPMCDEKLVTLRGNQAVAPNFNLFTQVPLPTHFYGLTVNDLGLSQDKTQTGFGEAQPLPHVPMGIYDFTGRLVDTVITDYNGMYEALEPSTSTYNCPLPAGPCPGMYYFKGNDPGQPGHVNPQYNPRFRTIGTNFQAWPGLYTVTDTAPTQVAVTALTPGTQQIAPVQCDVTADTPQIFAVDKPYIDMVTGGFNGRVVSATLAGNSTSATYQFSSTDGLTVGQNVTVSSVGQRFNGTRRVSAVSTDGIHATIAATSGRTATTSRQGTVTFAPTRVASSATAVTVTGAGFGATQGAGRVTLDFGAGAGAQAMTVTSWSDTKIVFTTPAGRTFAPGAATLAIQNNGGKSSVNGLTLQFVGLNNAGQLYPQKLVVVNPPAGTTPVPGFSGFGSAIVTSTGAVDANNPETAVQDAIEAAGNQGMVVVFPGPAVTNNPTGDYFENLIVSQPVKLQGVGPGGVYADGTAVLGSRLNGLGFNPDSQAGTNWINTINATPHAGPADVPDAAVLTVLAANDGVFNQANTAGFKAAVDGFTVTGGSQSGFPTNIDTTNGGTTTPAGAPGALITQGGGIYLHDSANNLQITDNIVVGNSGTYGGGIRVGTAYVNTSNDRVVISRNRIRDNGGSNLAGGIGIFQGTSNYSIDHNDLCGNFSAEYGGAITHYGRSNNGTIANNRIWYNQSYDEGGGVMVAGELPLSGATLSPGAGPVTINDNLVQQNLANDDGGGLRFLSAGDFEIDVVNNMLVNNISAHEGGGIALDDSTNVHITGNTVAKNITTATAATSQGQAAPAGLSTAGNSAPLIAALNAARSPRRVFDHSRPQDFRNNVFSDNRAGSWAGGASTTIAGISDADANVWDMGSLEPLNALLNPTNTALGTTNLGSVQASTSNRTGSPAFVKGYTSQVQAIASRVVPTFRQLLMVANTVSPGIPGDYHLGTGSSALGLGTVNGFTGTLGSGTARALYIAADLDGQSRPQGGGYDAGADEAP
jgi:hypothetical protein